MAVSPQHLRPISLLDSVRAYLTPELISGASSAVREPESATRTALNTSIPSVLAGLTHLSSSSEGVTKLGSLVREGAFAPVADNASSLFGGGTPTTNMMSAGQQLLGNIFGENSSSVTDMLARNSGIRSSSASSLMGMTAPLVLGVIGKYASSQGLNASGIASLLRSQKESIFGALPSGMSQLIGLSGPRVVPPLSTNTYRDTPTTAVRDIPSQTYSAAPTVPSATSSKKWLWIALIALAALLLWMFARGRGPGSLTRLSLPNGTSISVPEGSLNYNLASYLGSQAQDVPRTFVFDHLNFQTASTELTPDSVQSVSDLTAILKAYPNSHVTLTGHTDNTGDVDANQRLSVDRANAVKAMLVSGGVPPDRISTAGYGQSRPIAANDTDEGRTRNRRIELTVNSK